jgi:NAD-dependent dihydropyrimidine dehydrogenase PreA subunit
MTYIIAEPCVNVRDRACVEVCPVDCIYEVDENTGATPHGAQAPDDKKQMLYIHPEECIDCGACEPVCPVDAIFMDEETPDKWKAYIELNYVLSGVEFDG